MPEKNKKLLLLGIALLIISIINIAVFAKLGHISKHSTTDEKDRCLNLLPEYKKTLTKEYLNESLNIGTNFIINNQRPDGHFNYGYHWINKKEFTSDNLINQAEVLWYLILVYKGNGDKSLVPHINKGLKVFTERLDQFHDKKAWITNPKKGISETEIIALVTLSLTDYIEISKDINGHDRSFLISHLTKCLNHLISFSTSRGRFYKYYRLEGDNYHGEPDLRVDGKAILAFTKAAKYMDRDDLKNIILDSLLNKYLANIDSTLKENPAEVKPNNFIYIAEMIFFELATSGWGNTERFYNKSFQLANWIIEDYNILNKDKNITDVLQGIILAYELSRQSENVQQVNKFACVIDKVLNKFTLYQIASYRQNKYLFKHRTFDEKAIGGVLYDNQFHVLKTGVTSKQMYSVLLARQYCYN